MRLLVACPDCKRQYDAGKLAPGSRFHCVCGATLRVHRTPGHDAAVVRCSSCGAPREAASAACRFCGADFTLHERDLHTICPECLARVSDSARFCHHCAAPLLPTGDAGEPTDRLCPACGDGRHLNSRRLGDPGVTLLECARCAGLWLSNEELQLVLERSRAPLGLADSIATAEARGAVAEGRSPAQGPLYRPCPECGKLMHRRNYGQKSGVIIDSCAAHGAWFDAQELDAIVRWVRRGGETRAGRHLEEERRAAERRARLARRLEPEEPDLPGHPAGLDTLLDFLGWLGRAVLRP
jgi:Zn-finger nucleic acid-binding protein